MTKQEEDVDIVGGVCPLAITSAPELVEEEDEYMDICGKASSVNNLDEDAIIINNPISSRSNSNSNSACDIPAVIAAAHIQIRASTVQIQQSAHQLIALGKESSERQQKEARSRAREKARQNVLLHLIVHMSPI